MKPSTIYTLVIATACAVLGYYFGQQEGNKEKRRSNEHAENRLNRMDNANPQQRTHELANGQITVIDIPAPMIGMSEFMEVQRCYVWKDAGGQSTMSCPNPPQPSFSD